MKAAGLNVVQTWVWFTFQRLHRQFLFNAKLFEVINGQIVWRGDVILSSTCIYLVLIAPGGALGGNKVSGVEEE